MYKISDNISYKEATKSYQAIRRGLDNTPDENQLHAMRLTAKQIFQPVREHFKVPIAVTSFFRSPEVNKAVGGVSSSHHTKGQAIDVDADVYQQKLASGEILTNKMIFDYIAENLDYDTIIWEFGTEDDPAWVHISYVRDNNRKRKLRAFRDWRGKTHYANY